jgi:hypothetical protein
MVVYKFSKKWRAALLQPNSEFDGFKRHPKRKIFEYIFWLNGLFLGDDDCDFLKEEVKLYI